MSTESHQWGRVADDGTVYVRTSDGERVVGIWQAGSPDQALALVGEIVRSESGPLLIDAVFEQEPFINGLTGAGWTIERPFQRMRFGDATTLAAELPFAVAGPEFG